MATNAQINAAIANSRHSTGPRTPEGKAASSRNSLKLGLFAQAEILPGEDPAALARLARDFEAEFEPQGPLEILLVNNLVRAVWLEHRYARIEAEIVNIRYAALAPEDRQNALGAIFLHDAEGANVLHKIERRRAAARRQAERARQQIQTEIARRFQALSRDPDSVPPDPPTPNPVTEILADPVRFDSSVYFRPAPVPNPSDNRKKEPAAPSAPPDIRFSA